MLLRPLLPVGLAGASARHDPCGLGPGLLVRDLVERCGDARHGLDGELAVLLVVALVVGPEQLREVVGVDPQLRAGRQRDLERRFGRRIAEDLLSRQDEQIPSSREPIPTPP